MNHRTYITTFLFLSVLLSVPYQSRAQHATLDKLEQSLADGQSAGLLPQADSALSACIKRKDSLGIARSLCVLGRIHYLEHHPQQAREAYDRALEVSRRVGYRKERAYALAGIGRLYISDNRGSAVEYLRKSLRIFRELGDDRGMGSTLFALGFIAAMQGKFERALQELNSGEALIRKTNDRLTLAAILREKGNTHAKMGDYHEALPLFRSALKIAESIGNRREASFALTGIGLVYSNLGNIDSAMVIHKHLLHVQEKDGDIAGTIATRLNIGKLLHEMDRYKEAQTLFTRAMNDAEKLRDLPKYSIALLNLGVISNALGNFEKALDYYLRCVPVKQQLGDQHGLASLYMNVGALYSGRGEVDRGLKYFLQSLETCEAIGAKAEMTKVLLNIGTTYFVQSKHEQALGYSLRGLEMAEQIGSKSDMALAAKQISRIYEYLGDIGKALEYSEQNVRLADAAGSPTDRASAYLQYGAQLMLDGKDHEALRFFKKSLTLRRYFGDSLGIGVVYNNISGVYANIADFGKAIAMNDTAISIFEAILDTVQLVRALHNQGTYYAEQGQDSLANRDFNRGMDLARRKDAVHVILDIEHELSREARRRGNFREAYDHHIRYVEIRDSLWRDDDRRETAALAARYESEKKEQQIELQRLELQHKTEALFRRQLEQQQAEQQIHLLSQEKEIHALQLDSSEAAFRIEQLQHQRAKKEAENLRQREALNAAKISRQQVIVIALGAGVVMLLIIGILLQRRARAKRQNAALRAEAAELEARAAEAESNRLAAQHAKREKEAQQQFARGLIRAQEDERARIANDLHDSLGQELVVIKNRTLLAMRDIDDREKLNRQLEQVVTRADAVIQSMRGISHNLRPLEIDRVGFTETIRGILRDIGEITSLRVQSDVDPLDQVFNQDEQITVYRIIQEALVNVVKHADARTVSLNMKRDNGSVLVEIRDDGCGFNPSGILHPGENGSPGFGLHGMAERVEMLGGTFMLKSNPGEGTVVSIALPSHDSITVPSETASHIKQDIRTEEES